MKLHLIAALPVLARSPGVLDRLLRDLPELWISGTQGPGAQTPP
jgi:hypothetical protein